MNRESFFNKIMPEPNTGCWIWMGHVDANGYGKMYAKTNDGFTRAHRYSYHLFKGLIADKWVLHTCDNRLCVNPDHLFLGTSQENTKDRHNKGRSARGSSHGMTHLTESDVTEILSLYSTNKYGRVRLGRIFGVSSLTILRIVKGKVWRHVNFDREKIQQVAQQRDKKWLGGARYK